MLATVRDNVHINMRLTLYAERERELFESTNKKAPFRVKEGNCLLLILTLI